MFGMLGGDLSMLQCNIHFHSHLAPSNHCTFPPLSATDVMNHTANPRLKVTVGRHHSVKKEALPGD